MLMMFSQEFATNESSANERSSVTCRCGRGAANQRARTVRNQMSSSEGREIWNLKKYQDFFNYVQISISLKSFWNIFKLGNARGNQKENETTDKEETCQRRTEEEIERKAKVVEGTRTRGSKEGESGVIIYD